MNDIYMQKYYSDECFRKGALVRLDDMRKKRCLLPKSSFQTFLGKVHTNETKKKMSDAKKGKYIGTDNPQYGTCWIFNEFMEISKKIPKHEMQQYINEGWSKGRVVDFEKRKQTLLMKNTCNKCGTIKCKHPQICSKSNMINTLSTYFGFNKKTFGSLKFYEEYDRIVDVIRTEYEVNRLSTIAIVEKYNITSTQQLDSIFKSIGIKARTPKEAATNFHNNK